MQAEAIKLLVSVIQKENKNALEIPGKNQEEKLASLTLAIQIAQMMQNKGLSFEEAWDKYHQSY